jgi:cytidine deaminase
MNTKELIARACEARLNAHAPYSKYLVGAALLTKSGKVFAGCNVENASYGLTNCAERTAIFTAVAAGEKEFEAIAIAAAKPIPFPCGACRQVMSEFFNPDTPVYIVAAEAPDEIISSTMGELLPKAFHLD